MSQSRRGGSGGKVFEFGVKKGKGGGCMERLCGGTARRKKLDGALLITRDVAGGRKEKGGKRELSWGEGRNSPEKPPA